MKMGSEQYSSLTITARVKWVSVHSTTVDRSGCNHSRDSDDDLEGVADQSKGAVSQFRNQPSPLGDLFPTMQNRVSCFSCC
jgi:hypothetical protein